MMFWTVQPTWKLKRDIANWETGKIVIEFIATEGSTFCVKVSLWVEGMLSLFIELENVAAK